MKARLSRILRRPEKGFEERVEKGEEDVVKEVEEREVKEGEDVGVEKVVKLGGWMTEVALWDCVGVSVAASWVMRMVGVLRKREMRPKEVAMVAEIKTMMTMVGLSRTEKEREMKRPMEREMKRLMIKSEREMEMAKEEER